MDLLIGRMHIAPANLSTRLKHILHTEPRDALREMAQLVEELFSLVEAHMPAVDTAPSWAVFTRPQRPWQVVPLDAGG